MHATPRNVDWVQSFTGQGGAIGKEAGHLRVYLRVYRLCTSAVAIALLGDSCVGFGPLLVPTLTRTDSFHSSTTPTSPMSQQASTSTAYSRFQAIFDAALKSYQKQTKKDLTAHPLASQLQSCDSTNAIIAILQDKIGEFEQAHNSDERLTKWLNPTVNVLCAFSAAISGGVSLESLDM